MVFECNIDARGKAYRLKLGIMGVTVGLVFAAAFHLAGIEFQGILWIIPMASMDWVVRRASTGVPNPLVRETSCRETL